MNQFVGAAFLHIRSSVLHSVRTAMVRDDQVGWVVSGRKRLRAPSGEVQFTAGQALLLARATQWDIVNEPAADANYEARVIGFAPHTIERFYDRFGQFTAAPPVQACASSEADADFLTVCSRAMAALLEPDMSDAMREHRVLEVLLLLAERGLVFAPPRELTWEDRVCRVVRQRPHASWTVDDLAQAFHLSASTLQRRLALEGTSASRCVREVRLETAMALLQGTDFQVSDIAMRCGYESHSRFTSAFRQRFGYAPSHLRP
ncbi:helix-turn-helix transcriptional regulator [Curvibacter sp. CHRR-16]|uniref:helix-turn-helix transcriptional regulator n=1 Tax=Curvibacter sp. CHRR-16 TaxID=2835872 RepID=UPI001BD96F56|nr:helix-turn-helix transcriptional regulator [Curvibacter sp. CHRR-16]MBT0570019.1 helix-turn-helix transcriptional regulator [Curvibacter sp. CHRR-16]